MEYVAEVVNDDVNVLMDSELVLLQLHILKV